MFTLNHFILLAISAMIIIVYVLLNKHKQISFGKNITFMFIICIFSEVTKILVNMETIQTIDPITQEVIFEQSGTYLSPTSLPFHLCSIQIFFITALKFFVKKESTKSVILGFMFPSAVLGATCSLFIPTEGVSFTNPQVYEYFIYHACLIGFGITIIVRKWTTIDFKTIWRNFAFIWIITLFNLWVNSVLSYAHTNFLFLARPPLENLPYLNDNEGWLVYFIRLIIFATILLFIFQLPFAIHNHKKQKSDI